MTDEERAAALEKLTTVTLALEGLIDDLDGVYDLIAGFHLGGDDPG